MGRLQMESQTAVPGDVVRSPILDTPMNPYEATAATSHQLDVRRPLQRPVGPLVIAALLILAVLVGFLSSVVPAIGTVTMPRFGWIGLVICLNPLIFLMPWFWKPKRPALVCSGFMTCAIGVINGVQLYSAGTVSNVTNEFHDRLHSSWLWSVFPFFVAGAYLCWLAMRMKPLTRNPESGEPADARESPS
jgi:hypothetical protein